jgi:anti-anti-sigma regulatory factor
MKKLTIQLGGQRGCLGLSLRGNCITAADAVQLEQAVQQLLTTLASAIWVDCQQLHVLSPLGQHTLLQADRRARAVGATCYWCGLAEDIVEQLASSGLEMRASQDFRGPGFLVASSQSQAVLTR